MKKSGISIFGSLKFFTGSLGLSNILFAWLGMAFFVIPLMIAVFKGDKAYCNRYCGRGQLFELLGRKI